MAHSTRQTRKTSKGKTSGTSRSASPVSRSKRTEWGNVQVTWPQPKQAISLRIDQDILEWFRDARTRLPDPHERRAARIRRCPAGQALSRTRRTSSAHGHLVAAVARDAAGNLLPAPYGPQAMGRVVFNADGRMMAVLCDGRASLPPGMTSATTRRTAATTRSMAADW